MNERLAAFNARRAHEAKRSRTRRQLPKNGARTEKIDYEPCRQCGSKHGIEHHHIVHRAKIGSSHPKVHHPDNAMPLCHACHQAHHTTVEGRIPRRLLSPAELEFAVKHASIGWVDRWYPA